MTIMRRQPIMGPRGSSTSDNPRQYSTSRARSSGDNFAALEDTFDEIFNAQEQAPAPPVDTMRSFLDLPENQKSAGAVAPALLNYGSSNKGSLGGIAGMAAGGAATGASLGGPTGALVGGAAGLVSGALDYFSTRRAEREQKALLKAEVLRKAREENMYRREAERLKVIEESRGNTQWEYTLDDLKMKKMSDNQAFFQNIHNNLSQVMEDTRSRAQRVRDGLARGGI